jgi:hypothetical protein
MTTMSPIMAGDGCVGFLLRRLPKAEYGARRGRFGVSSKAVAT